MVLGVIWPPNPPPPAHSIGHQDHHHHLIPHIPPHPYIVPRRRLQRHTLNRAITARFRVSGPQHLPWLAFANASPRDRRRLVRAIPPSPPTSLRRRLTRQNRNRATAARFRVFGTPPSPRLAFANAPPRDRRRLIQATPPPPLTSLPCSLTRQNRNRATAAQFRVFAPPTPSPPRVCKRTNPQPP